MREPPHLHAELADHEQVAAALRESESRFREMVDGLPLIVWVHDAAGEQELVNETFCEFFGVTREEMRGGRWQLLMHPDDADAYRAEFFACVRDRRPFQHQVRVRRADGCWRWIESWARPRITAEGEFRGYVGTSADITDRIEFEERLRESGRRKDEFLALLGHELRNPLAAIRSATELIEQMQIDDSRLRSVQEILQRQTSQMKVLIDGLLDLSRIAQGKISLVRQPLDLREPITSVVQDYARQAGEHGVVLEYALPEQPLWISGDSARLTQIFDNVLGNALKFTPAPGTITVMAHRDGAEVAVRIQDTGLGIRADLLPRIFDPFEQETREGTEPTGLGLGLAVAKRLVELHQGSIRACSGGVGNGAEFEVRLPLSAPARAAAPTVRDTPSPPRRILLVEDDPDAGFTMRELLASEGHEVFVAEDGDAGLELVRRHRPDLVLCDIGLPGMSGYELARRIRADASLNTVLLVALTGYGRPEDRERAEQSGFDAHFTKPAELRTLRELLRRSGGAPDS